MVRNKYCKNKIHSRIKRQNRTSKSKNFTKIKKNTIISELAEKYPEIVNFLACEYNFHCAGCSFAKFEELGNAAKVHGVEGKDFEEMLVIINEMAKEHGNL
ncbi:DUF1858 domain-containing protein [Candidatus Dojkabacteria bacterium]|nr:DUF1858 domain-containing protein [Candidatus Dojkabacteria bacterium]